MTLSVYPRQQTQVEGVTAVQGDFSLPSELQRLPERPIDVVVHLAAVTGGGTEAEQLRVNVLGSHYLVRHCLEHGCKKFVLASLHCGSWIPVPSIQARSNCRCPMNTRVLTGSGTDFPNT